MELLEDHAQDEQNPVSGDPAMPAVAVWTRPENAASAHKHIADTQAKSYNQEGNVHTQCEDCIVDHSKEERKASRNLQKTLPLMTQITLICADFSHLLLF